MMFMLIAIALACAEARQMAAEPDHPSLYCGPSFPFIIGGSQVSINQHPHQISLQSSHGGHMCGGAIMSSTKIVSAAHCTQKSASSYRIRAGSSDRPNGGQIRSVSRI